MSYYKEQLNNWLKTLDIKADFVLDIGGGANPVKNRTGNWEVKEYWILDNGSELVKGESEVIFYDLNIEQVVVAKADIVFCLEVFEYIYNPIQALGNIYENLKEGGIAYISFPFNYPVHNPIKIDYLRYTKEGIIKLLKITGFSKYEITARKATKGLNYLGGFYSIEGMHPVRHNDVIFDLGYMVKAFKAIDRQ